jgi:hypothetical protein
VGDPSGRYHVALESCQEARVGPRSARALNQPFQNLFEHEQREHLAYIEEYHRMREVGPTHPMAFDGRWLSRGVRRRHSSLS